MHFSHFLWDTNKGSLLSVHFLPSSLLLSLSSICLSLPPYFSLCTSHSWFCVGRPSLWHGICCPRSPGNWWNHYPWKYSKGMGMWHLRICFSHEYHRAGLMVGLSLRAFFKPAQFCGEMTITSDCQIWLQGRQILRVV